MMCLLLYSWGSDHARMKVMRQCVHDVLGRHVETANSMVTAMCFFLLTAGSPCMMTETFDAEERPCRSIEKCRLHYFISLLFKIVMILMLFVCACSNLRVIDSRISTSYNRFRTRGTYIVVPAAARARTYPIAQETM